MKSHTFTHRGKQLFYVDFSNFRYDLAGLREELEAVTTLIESQRKSSVLGLVDIRNTALSLEAATMIKETAPELGPYIYKAAIILNKVTGLKSVMLTALARVGGREAILFDNVEKAKDWLVSET